MSRSLFRRALTGLTRNVAFTAPGADDPRLRGRTYAIPFEDVWQSAVALVDGGLNGWTLREYDDHDGIIRGAARGRLKRFSSAVTVRIVLDADAQTRVDAMSASRVGRYDLGTNVRRLDLFFRSLDRRLEENRGHPVHPLRDRSGG